MRFTTIILTGAFALLASAQTTSGTTATAATTTYSLTPAQSSQAACLEACDAGDVDCESKCIAVPNPNGSQVNATNDCVAACPQGNGTAADNDDYASCVNDCIGANYFTSTGTPAQSTGDSSSDSTATGSDSAATATGTSTASSGSSDSSSSSSATGSSASASASASGSAADAVRVGVTGVSLFGLLAAFVAL